MGKVLIFEIGNAHIEEGLFSGHRNGEPFSRISVATASSTKKDIPPLAGPTA